jgi:NTE family protein
MTVTSPSPAADPGAPQPAKPIDLVLEGGGVKGIGLVGAILELDAAGYQVSRVAGTSAGAIVASIVAALRAKDRPLSELHDVLTTCQYDSFMRNGGLRGKLGGLGAASGLMLHMGLYDGDYLIEWLGKVLAGIGVTYFSDLPLDDPGADKNLTASQLYTLVVHTSDITRGKIVRLPWDYPAYGFQAGNQRVVDAVRASMAIPFFFEPVRFRAPAGTIGDQDCDAGDVVWVDGGMLDNYPLDVFDRTDGAPSRWPTIGIKLSAQEVVVKGTAGDDNVASETMSCLRTLLDNADRYYVDSTKQPFTIFVDSDGISATDFHLSAQAQQTLFENGQSAARAWIAAQSTPGPPGTPTGAVQATVAGAAPPPAPAASAPAALATAGQ